MIELEIGWRLFAVLVIALIILCGVVAGRKDGE